MSQTRALEDLENFRPTNKSTAKQLYSFGKGNRFNYARPDQLMHEIVGYNLPSTLRKSASSFGKGVKKTLQILQPVASPDPGTYEIPSDFTKTGNFTNRGLRFTFGVGREAYAKVYVKGKGNLDQTLPGPGTYTVLQKTEARNITLKPRVASMCKFFPFI